VAESRPEGTVDDRSVVVLVGMMGSGKSTVGRLLAERIGVPFCDTDEVVCEEVGTTIAEIFATMGEEAFREMEPVALAACVARSGVVATGGGVVLRESNRLLMSSNNVRVVWLDATLEGLAARLEGDSERPLLGDDTRGALVDLDRQRRPLYAQVASIRIDTTTRTPQEVCDELAAWIGVVS